MILSNRALNRALLERQLLLRRSAMPVAEATKWLVGMQAQAPGTPYVALWSRLKGFGPEALSRLIEGREAVRIAIMRSTLHLLTAKDCIALRQLMQPPMTRAFSSGSQFGRKLAGLDLEPVLAAGRAYFEEKPRTLTQPVAKRAQAPVTKEGKVLIAFLAPEATASEVRIVSAV